jgi:NAD(P)-dependent dehydrogenase (short-subunit alcohol dehydrogenase family)
VDGFTQALRREVCARGGRVHTVHPGPVRPEWLPLALVPGVNLALSPAATRITGRAPRLARERMPGPPPNRT